MAKKGSWIVQAKCEVTKQIVCENCTEEQARESPFDHAVDEQEIDQTDYEVIDVRPNK